MNKRPLALAGSLAATVGILAGLVAPLGASSHREAPGISRDPTADNTDVYAFVSPDKPDTVTFVANYIPLQHPAGGPNFNSFGDDVLYEIHIDNDGDARTDIDYQFRFDTKLRNPNSFLYNTGPIDSLDDPDWNLPQTYSVTRVEEGRRRVLGNNLKTPPVNVGPRSTPNYDMLASQAVTSIQGDRMVFAGQRDDPFYVDLGSVFDLGGLRPFNPAHLIPRPESEGVDAVAGFNVHSIVLQVPITDLTRDKKMPKDASDPNAIIGVYASASRQQTTVLKDNGRDNVYGDWIQVSRLGHPLINEVIIPLGRKDRWNRDDPYDDRQFLQFYRRPELAGLVNLLYPVLPDAQTMDREDLVAVLLTGIKGLNMPGDKAVKADLLRLNMMIPPTSSDPNAVDRLGAIAGQLDGYPNGRRLRDDIVDIQLRAVACGYGPILQNLLGLCNLSPNNMIGDGVERNDEPLLPKFPYVPSPHQGYEMNEFSDDPPAA
jgi:hypothetical protein